MIAPYIKNMKRKNSKYELEQLKPRCKIEDVNAVIKDYNRIYVRRHRFLVTYKHLFTWVLV